MKAAMFYFDKVHDEPQIEQNLLYSETAACLPLDDLSLSIEISRSASNRLEARHSKLTTTPTPTPTPTPTTTADADARHDGEGSVGSSC